ncbi:MAG: hypothetical protein GTO41_12725 [Burkholderiales bacterium]|nr:hypothetical protein [Burkholderiales bacterium]
MYRRQFIAAIVGALLALGSAGAWACKAAGPDTHVGMLQSVDTRAKSFTIIDAETRGPITFSADEAILNSLKDVRGMIAVLHEKVGGVLRALEVTRY